MRERFLLRSYFTGIDIGEIRVIPVIDIGNTKLSTTVLRKDGDANLPIDHRRVAVLRNHPAFRTRSSVSISRTRFAKQPFEKRHGPLQLQSIVDRLRSLTSRGSEY